MRGARHTPHPGSLPPSRDELDERLGRAGLSPRWWSNAAGDSFEWHVHTYAKVLYCVRGSVVFHFRDADAELLAGDRLDLEAGTEHAATVGPDGVTCVEAGVPGDAGEVILSDSDA